ncbi:cytochrome D1 domain-containing protein [Malaciobacter mytili]|uniref:cytochrome D1 domain-containing protein n=1 Tax=Malaciobacter mytili TaxID=603050 RepID=UPI003A8658CC
MKIRRVLGILTISCLGLTSLVNAKEIKLSKEEMQKATQVYFDRCAGCHGMLRKGALGPSLEATRSKEFGTETLKHIINSGTPGGMPGWGKTGELTKEETELMAKYIQIEAPLPPEKSMDDMKKSHKILIPVKDRPKAPEAENWKDYFAVILRDVGEIAIIDGVTKKVVSVVPSGFATHITRTGASGRYMYVIGRDGKASMIDLWMKVPKNVAEIRTCNDARAIDTSKHPDYKDKYAIVGCYWPPSIVTLEADTLEPLKIVSTASYTYDTQEFTREARVAAIIASHERPEWVVNIKETGQVWLYDYSDIKNPKITMVDAERYLHDGGWDLSKRYFMTAANARNIISVIDTVKGNLVANIPSQGIKPHPGRGVNVNSKKYGPIWGSGHIGSNDIIFIGTDPVNYPQNAWKVVKKISLPGEGGGNLFIKGHPNSPYIFADRPVNPDRKLQTQIYVIDKESLEVVKTIPIPKKYLTPAKTEDGKEVASRGPVHFEFNADGSEVWTSIWGNKLKASPILIYDSKTLELKSVIDDKRLITPTGKFNVTNTMTDTY